MSRIVTMFPVGGTKNSLKIEHPVSKEQTRRKRTKKVTKDGKESQKTSREDITTNKRGGTSQKEFKMKSQQEVGTHPESKKELKSSTSKCGFDGKKVTHRSVGSTVLRCATFLPFPIVVYYESINRELNKRLIFECWCD